MAAHCPYCDSSDITPLVTPSGISYFHCNSCNRNFITPVYDLTSVVEALLEDAPTTIEVEGQSSES